MPETKTEPTMLSRAVLCELSLGCWGTERKVAADKVDIKARVEKDAADQETKAPSASMVRLTKSLLKCEELDAIKKLDGKIRQFLYTRALPSIRHKGMYFIPIVDLRKIDARMEEFREERQGLVDAFCAVYAAEQLKAAAQLGALYDSREYPPVGDVRDAFTFVIAYISTGVSESLKDMYPELWKREQEKAQAQWAAAELEIQQALRRGLKDIVDHMMERLKGNGDGKPKVFRDSMVENLKEFLALFEPRNITDDVELAKLVDYAKTVVQDVDVKDLRDTPRIRDQVVTGLSQVKNVLDTMIVDKPGRAMLPVD